MQNSNFGLQLLESAQTVETVETVEIENLNQFNFEVIERPIYLNSGRQITGFKALVRSDNENILNVCNESYSVISNAQFCELVFKLSEITGFEVNSFSEFQDGRKVLAFLKAPETALNGWQFSNYLAIGNSHDSTKALFVALTQIMIRCQNQFTALSKGALKAYHTSGKDWKIDNIKRSIALYNEQQNVISANYSQMLETNRTETDVQNFMSHLFDVDLKTAKDDEISTRKKNQMIDFIGCLRREVKDVGLNDFGLFCAVTRYTTHVRNQKDKTFGNVFGSNADFNNKALRFFNYLN